MLCSLGCVMSGRRDSLSLSGTFAPVGLHSASRARNTAPARCVVVRPRAPAGAAPEWGGLEIDCIKNGPTREAPGPWPKRRCGMFRSERDRIVRIRGHGRTVHGLVGGLRRGGRAVAPVRLVEELHPGAGHQQDLGGEPVGVLPVLAPAPGLQLGPRRRRAGPSSRSWRACPPVRAGR